MVYQAQARPVKAKTTTKVPGPFVVAGLAGWPDPQDGLTRGANHHNIRRFSAKSRFLSNVVMVSYRFTARSRCRRPNSSNAAGTAVTTMPAPTSVRCTPNVAASHGAIASGATPANILPKPMTEFTRPSCSSGAVVCTMVLWSGLTMPQAMPRRPGRQGPHPRTVSPHRADFPGPRT